MNSINEQEDNIDYAKIQIVNRLRHDKNLYDKPIQQISISNNFSDSNNINVESITPTFQISTSQHSIQSGGSNVGVEGNHRNPEDLPAYDANNNDNKYSKGSRDSDCSDKVDAFPERALSEIHYDEFNNFLATLKRY